MTAETVLGLLGFTASVIGLALDKKEIARKAALTLLALLALCLVVSRLLYQQRVTSVQNQIIASVGNTLMSADQLYETTNNVDIARPLFDDALNQAIGEQRILHRMLELHTPDGTSIRVRGYFAP